MRLLARREHSQLELLNKLQAKGFSADCIGKVVVELANEGWQSDDRFAENYIRSRIQRGYGPIRIDSELRQRGIEHADLEQVATELAISWKALIEQVYARKYNDDAMAAGGLPWNERVKRMRFLQQRGFSAEMIRLLFDH